MDAKAKNLLRWTIIIVVGVFFWHPIWDCVLACASKVAGLVPGK